MSDEAILRRRWLQGVGSVIVTSKLCALTGCGSDPVPANNPAGGSTSSGSAGTSSGSSGSSGTGTSSGAPGPNGSDAGVCELYPVQVEGPYYLDDQLVRRDITEGKPGVPLTLRVKVLRGGGGACAAIPNAIVDVWHNDAGGVYSGYPGQVGNVDTTGQKFLRGLQATNAAGEAEITTIYPGWYPGRTTHIHFKVHLDNRSLVTSQMYFPEEINAAVYGTGVYAGRGQKDTSNVRDGIAGSSQAVLAKVTGSPQAGYVAELTVVVAG